MIGFPAPTGSKNAAGSTRRSACPSVTARRSSPRARASAHQPQCLVSRAEHPWPGLVGFRPTCRVLRPAVEGHLLGVRYAALDAKPILIGHAILPAMLNLLWPLVSLSAMRRNLTRSNVLAMLSTVAVLGAPGLVVPALADAAPGSTFPILVMGDSYSAGNGAGDYTGPKGCWRSPNNYAGLYSQALNQPPYDQLSYVASSACSGDKTSSFFSTTSGRAPQLDSVNKRYGLILLTIGGDDVGFAGIVQNCLIVAFVNVSKCKAFLGEADTLLSDGTIEGRLRRVLNGIRSRADSRAVIALLGYPYLESDSGYVIDKGAPDAFNVGGWLRRIEDKGDAIQQRLVAELDLRDHTSSFVFVKTKALFKGHELSATSSNPDRWFIEPLTDSTIASRFTWYHPNPTGWAAEAKLLLSDPNIPKHDPIGATPPHPVTHSGRTVDLLDGSTLATFTGHIADDRRCGGPEAAPNSCQLNGVTIGTTPFTAAWWTAGYDTSDAITFSLDGRFQMLSGMLGIVSVSGSGCEEYMQVTGDSHELFGERMAGARSVSLDVSGVDQVTVSATVVAQGEGDCQAGFGAPTGIVSTGN